MRERYCRSRIDEERGHMSAIKQTEEVIEYIESLKDEQGRACLDLNLTGGAELYDPLTYGNDRDLNGKIYRFIDQRASIIPTVIPLHLRIHGGPFSEDERENIAAVMSRHYATRANDVTVEMMRSNYKLLLMLILGGVVLTLGVYLSVAHEVGVLSEVLSIVASFALCEAATTFLIDQPRLKRDYENLMQSKKMTLEFIENGVYET